MNPPQAILTIEARPAPVSFEPRRTAVIVVDMQNDSGSAGGMFARAGIDISGIQGAVAPTARVLAAARRAGLLVVYLKMAFRPDLSDAGAPDAPNWIKHLPLRAGEAVPAPDGAPGRILIRDTWNTDILAALAPEPSDIVVYKHRFSGFFGTDLDDLLRRRSISTLVFTGCTTSVCVEATLRDAMMRDYTCLLLEDCTAEPLGAGLPRGNHEATLLVVQVLLGWTAQSSDLIAALEDRCVEVAHGSRGARRLRSGPQPQT